MSGTLACGNADQKLKSELKRILLGTLRLMAPHVQSQGAGNTARL